jgi:hypothetical protein
LQPFNFVGNLARTKERLVNKLIPRSENLGNLRREWPANNPIGNRHLEKNVALDAWNCLVTNLSGESWAGINVDLLFGFTARTFHRHHNIAFVGH